MFGPVHTYRHINIYCIFAAIPPPHHVNNSANCRQVPGIPHGARGSRFISTQHTCRDGDHVCTSHIHFRPCCSFISPPPLMWDTLESPGNSPGERRRVDLGSSRRRGLPLIPVASRLLLQPPTVDFNHSLHHPSPRPR